MDIENIDEEINTKMPKKARDSSEPLVSKRWENAEDKNNRRGGVIMYAKIAGYVRAAEIQNTE